MDSKDFNFSSKIPRFDSLDDYYVWQFKIGIAARRLSVFSILQGEEERKEDDNDFLVREATALDLVTTNVGRTLMTYVSDSNDPHVIWERFKTLHSAQSEANKGQLRRTFHRLTLEQGDSIMKLVNQVKTLSFDLKAAGENIDDKDMKDALISAVSDVEGYHHVITALDARKEEEVTFDIVVNRLLHEEVRLQQRQSEKVLTSTQSANKSSTGTECFKCGQEGHIARNCRQSTIHNNNSRGRGFRGRGHFRGRDNFQRGRFGRSGQRGRMSGRGNSERGYYGNTGRNEQFVSGSDYAFVAGLQHDTSAKDPRWIRDPGSTANMTWDRADFISKSFRYLENPTKVTFGKKSNFALAKGMGNVMLEIQTETGPSQEILADVLWVPELDVKLFSTQRLKDTHTEITAGNSGFLRSNTTGKKIFH